MPLHGRCFPPSAAFVRQANAREEIYRSDPAEFWASEARLRVTWAQDWAKVREDDRWFVNARLNACFNCVDRHVESGKGSRTALLFEGAPGDRRELTYAELRDEVIHVAAALADRGASQKTRIGICLAPIPELAITMLACARIGAPHVVVSPATPTALGRVACEVIVTQDARWTLDGAVPLKALIDDVAPDTVRLVVRRVGNPVPMTLGRDHWLGEARRSTRRPAPAALDGSAPLFDVIDGDHRVTHSIGGYLVGVAASHHYIFDAGVQEDVYWAPCDPASIEWHSYGLYGPFCNRATSVLYELATAPAEDRWWDVCRRYAVTALCLHDKTVRQQAASGVQPARDRDLGSLRVLGALGGRLAPDTWRWYHGAVGDGCCPVVDAWMLPETGMIAVTPLPGATRGTPGAAGRAFPGAVVDVDPPPGPGRLVLQEPGPALASGIGRPYVTSTQAWVDSDGDIWFRQPPAANVATHDDRTR